MQLEFRLIKRDCVLQIESIPHIDPLPGEWVQTLEEAIRKGCRQLNIPLPIWMKRNTTEFARFRQTVFFADQFLEPVKYDRLQIRLLPEADSFS